MNYIFDISLNFNDKLYDFYDWNTSDDITYYLKIPVIRVDDNTLIDFISSDILIDSEFVSKIKNKNEVYLPKTKDLSSVVALFTSLNSLVAIMFDENGKSIKKSSLSIEEENEVLDYAKLLKINDINYKIIRKNNSNNFLTRKEEKMKDNLIKVLNEIYNKNEFDKLEYIFFEVYNEKCSSKEKMHSKLLNLINNNSNKLIKLNNVVSKLSRKNTYTN